jgi:hypothetical protein
MAMWIYHPGASGCVPICERVFALLRILRQNLAVTAAPGSAWDGAGVVSEQQGEESDSSRSQPRDSSLHCAPFRMTPPRRFMQKDTIRARAIPILLATSSCQHPLFSFLPNDPFFLELVQMGKDRVARRAMQELRHIGVDAFHHCRDLSESSSHGIKDLLFA